MIFFFCTVRETGTVHDYILLQICSIRTVPLSLLDKHIPSENFVPKLELQNELLAIKIQF